MPQPCNNGQWEDFYIPQTEHHPPPAKWCMRSSNTFGSGQQCCYTIKGKLIKSGVSAGTPDRQAAKFLNVFYLPHFMNDVDTYNLADRLGRTNDYLKVRPPSQGNGSCYE